MFEQLTTFPGRCPLVPGGRGLTLEMEYEGGETQLYPYMPWFEVEQFEGLGATLVYSSETESAVIYRQLEWSGDAVLIPRHRHNESDERIHVISGVLEFRDCDAALGAGDSFFIPKGTWHSPLFRKDADGRPCVALIVWDPAFQGSDIRPDVCVHNEIQKMKAAEKK